MHRVSVALQEQPNKETILSTKSHKRLIRGTLEVIKPKWSEINCMQKLEIFLYQSKNFCRQRPLKKVLFLKACVKVWSIRIVFFWIQQAFVKMGSYWQQGPKSLLHQKCTAWTLRATLNSSRCSNLESWTSFHSDSGAIKPALCQTCLCHEWTLLMIRLLMMIMHTHCLDFSGVQYPLKHFIFY